MRKFLIWAAIMIGALLVLCLVVTPFALRFGILRLPLAAAPFRFGWMDGMRGMHPFARPGMMGGGWMVAIGVFGRLLFDGLLIAGVVLLVLLLVRAFTRPQPTPPVAGPSGVAPFPPVSNLQQAAPGQPVQPGTCSHCGRGLQADWVACPYCGVKI